MIILCHECDRPLTVPNVRAVQQAQCGVCGARYEITVTMVTASPLEPMELAGKRNRNS